MRRTACLLAMALTMSGCLTGSDRTPTLRVSNWGGAGEDNEYDKLVNRMYREFGEQNGCQVRVEGIPGEYVQKMLLNHVAGTMPDVMVVDASSAAVFVNNGMLRDLTPLAKADPSFSLDDYYANVVDIGRRGEKVFMVPGDFTPMVMYYNKDLFDAAGVPYPKPGWSFQDFLDTAKELTDKQSKRYGFAFTNWMPSWIMWIWNNGGDVLSPDGKRASGYFDSLKSVEAIEFLRRCVADKIPVGGRMVDNPDQVAPTLSETAALGVDLFANGQAAMTISGHWALVGYKAAPKDKNGKPKIDWRRLGVVELPTQLPKSVTVMYEAGLAIPQQAKNPDLAWKYIKVWTGYKLQRQYNESGIAVCARKDVSAERARDEIEAQFLPIIPNARPPWGAKVEGYAYVESMGKNALDSILNNGVPVKKALSYAAERIDLEFAKR